MDVDNHVDNCAPLSMATDKEFRRAAPLVNRHRVRIARELRGLSQAALVASMGNAISVSALSQIETGTWKPSSETLAALSHALDVPPGFFTRRDATPAGFFRSLRSAPAPVRRQLLAGVVMLHDLVGTLDECLKLPDLDLPRYQRDNPSQSYVETIARRVRTDLDLDDEPVGHVIRLIEDHGAIVTRMGVDRGDIDAFSILFQDRPIVVLGTDKAVPARSRFDVAHELGHLVMHGDEHAGSKQAEQEANWFAAAFLMPSGAMRDVLPTRIDWTKLLDLKAKWGVSMGALLMRAKTLEVISDHAYLNGVKTMSARGWRRTEPGDHLVAVERPATLDRASRALKREGIDVNDLAKMARLSADDVRRLLEPALDARPSI